MTLNISGPEAWAPSLRAQFDSSLYKFNSASQDIGYCDF